MSNDTPKFLWRADQLELLHRLLDEIIPGSEERNIPSAGSVPVAEYLAERSADVDGLGGLLTRGLEVAHTLAAAGASAFIDWTPEDRRDWAVDLERLEPTFFAALVRYTYMSYYTHPDLPPRIGLSKRPPHPYGYEVPPDSPDDLDRLIAPVKNRGTCYLEC